MVSMTFEKRTARRKSFLRLFGAATMPFLLTFTLNAQGVPALKDYTPATMLGVPPRAWAVEVAANELLALHHTGSYLRYRMHVIDEKGNQLRDVIESKDGTVARLIMRDDRPLTDEEDQAERQRLADQLASPSAFAKHINKEESGRKMADEMIKLMPDAMVYSYIPGQPQTMTNSDAPQVVLDYKPNPGFSAPTTASQALSGLEGKMWIDARSRQLIRMEGTIFQPVNLGWGMLAHIYPGGKLVLEQTNAGGQRWIFTHFSQQVSVRAFMVKTLNVKTNVDAAEFQVLPGALRYQDAIHILLDTTLPR